TNEEINGTIRFSLSDMNTEEEMLEAVKVLKESICDLRSIMKRK
ncbi:TPA: cysteine desulfurase NifS, partial [Clostridioides difficile]|nr:cysteine desulfurase NifS [Clostridioides difficile]